MDLGDNNEKLQHVSSQNSLEQSLSDSLDNSLKKASGKAKANLQNDSQEQSKKRIEQDSSSAEGQDLQTSNSISSISSISNQNSNINDYSANVNASDLKSKTENMNVDADRELYEEILEKLDIKKKEVQQQFQENFKQKNLIQEQKTESDAGSEQAQVSSKIGKALSNDFNQIQNMIKGGLINSEQGQNLKQKVLKKAFDMLVQSEKIKRNQSSAKTINKIEKSYVNQTNQGDAIENFSQNNPNFFSTEGRKEVLNYLKSGNVNLGKDELNQISNIVRVVEKAAIDGYLQKVAHEKTLRTSNQSAKQRLTANAQKSAYGENLSRTFNREQIGKMSSAEFAKYEPAIMDQLKKGLIH